MPEPSKLAGSRREAESTSPGGLTLRTSRVCSRNGRRQPQRELQGTFPSLKKRAGKDLLLQATGGKMTRSLP